MNIKGFLLCICLWANALVLFGQNERLFIGLELGMGVSNSFLLEGSNPSTYFNLNKYSYEEVLGFHFFYRLNNMFRVKGGYNYFTFTESYSLGGPPRKWLKNGDISWGYTMHHFPLLFQYQTYLYKHRRFNILFIGSLGMVYSRSENVDLNSGSLTVIVDGDTLKTNYGKYEYGILHTRNNFLPKAGLGFELEYYNKRNKIRKWQISFGYAIGTRRLHEHIIGSPGKLTKISSRGSFFDVSIAHFISISDIIPKKKRLMIQSERKDSRAYKLLYLKQ